MYVNNVCMYVFIYSAATGVLPVFAVARPNGRARRGEYRYIYIDIYVDVFMYISISICVYNYILRMLECCLFSLLPDPTAEPNEVYICLYIYICIYVYIYIYIYIYIYMC